MKKTTLLSLCSLLAAVILTGCGQEEALKMEPDQILKEMTQKMSEVKTSNVDGKVKVAIQSTEGSVNLDIDFDGKSDKTDLAKTEADMSIGVDGKVSNMGVEYSGSAHLDLIQKAQDIYLKLETLSVNGEIGSMIDAYVSAFKGQWYRLPTEMLPPEAKQALGPDTEQIKKLEKMRELAGGADFFDLQKDHGVEKVGGIDTVHYTVNIDRQGVKDFLKKLAQEMDQPIYDEEMTQLDVTLDSMTYSIDLWIDVDDFYLAKTEIAIIGNAPSGKEGEFDVRILMTMSDYDKIIKVEAPANTQDFNPLMLMGMMGGATPAGGLDTDLNSGE